MHTGSIFSELKRRKVYQTTAAYGAGVFVVWQVADIAIPALGLPPSLLRFVVITALLGFPIAIALSWALEVVPQSAVDGVSPARRPMTRRPLILVLSGLLVLGVAGWVMRPRSAMALDDGGWVIIADLRNETGDTVFDRVLDGALHLAMAQSPRVNLVGAPRIRQGLQEMRRAEDAPLDEPTAIELALRLGVGATLIPSLQKVGQRYVLGARLVDPVTEQTVKSLRESAASPDEILEALDRLTRGLRRELGETLGSMVRTPIQLKRATTGSLDALKAWTDGVRESQAGHDSEAGILFRRAVELDSTFALAQAALGQWYYWNFNDAVRGDSAFDRALAHLDDVTEREQFSIRGTVAEWRGDREEAARWFASLTRLMPQDPVGWSRLGYVYLRLGRQKEAIDAYQQVIRIDSLDANAWANLATLHYGEGDMEGAVPLYERAFTLQPAFRTRPVLNEEYGHDLVLLGRFSEAEALYGLMLAGTPVNRARGLRSMALLRTFTGRYSEATDFLREAVVLHQASRSTISEVRDRAFLAAAYVRLGRPDVASREIRTAHELSIRNRMPTLLLYTVGLLGARNGHLDTAEQLLDSATARTNGSIDERAALEHLKGEIAFGRGDPAAGIEHFVAAASLQTSGTGISIRLLSSLVRARLATGDIEQALALLDEATRTMGSATSRENQEDWILAHYQRARLLDELGRAADARTAYLRFLQLWSDADPGLREVVESRTAVARLTLG